MQDPFILKLQLLFNPDVRFQQLLPDILDKHSDTRVDEALELVDDHLLLSFHLQIPGALFLVELRIEHGLQVRVVNVLQIVVLAIVDDTFVLLDNRRLRASVKIGEVSLVVFKFYIVSVF